MKYYIIVLMFLPRYFSEVQIELIIQLESLPLPDHQKINKMPFVGRVFV